ncbi:helix-turn-helix domain-containing protein [Nocardia sp. A7]|uniref:helix-turn-helix domain-containing protein n=1 Tax=Nocardia sp. A7 TaxID=2789274 RepID=UPI0039795AAB
MTAALPKGRQQSTANERLRDAVFDARLTPDQLAEVVQVNPKTVQRWIGQGRIPYPVHQHSIAVALGVPERELWPDTFQQSRYLTADRAANRSLVRPEIQGEVIGGSPPDGRVYRAIDFMEPRERMRELMSWAPAPRSALADYRGSGNALADAVARQQGTREADYDR